MIVESYMSVAANQLEAKYLIAISLYVSQTPSHKLPLYRSRMQADWSYKAELQLHLWWNRDWRSKATRKRKQLK